MEKKIKKILLPALGAIVILGLLYAYFEKNFGPDKKDNRVFSVVVHKIAGSWVYDSVEEGLFQRKLSDSIQLNMDRYSEKLGNPASFIVTMSTEELPDYDNRMTFRRRSGGGYWYYSSVNNEELWLSGALTIFYGQTPPDVLYTKCYLIPEK